MKTAFFSILAPGKHLPPHRGPYKGVMRYHLGLLIPEPAEQCGIRVDTETRHWAEGESMIFDDTFEHEAWNDTDAHPRRAVRRLRAPAARSRALGQRGGALGDRLLAVHRRRQAPPQRLGEALRGDEGARRRA